MMLFAKAALGMSGALVLAGAYTFHEGVIRVDVDEYRAGGSHIHMWVPAAVVPMTMHFVPKHHWRDAAEQAREFLPLTHALIKELKKFPDADFVEVTENAARILDFNDCSLGATSGLFDGHLEKRFFQNCVFFPAGSLENAAAILNHFRMAA